MCQRKSFWRGTKCSQIVGLAQKIGTGTKRFETCKKTRHYTPKHIEILWELLAKKTDILSFINSFITISNYYIFYSDSDEETSPLQSREPTKAEILEEMTFALRKAMTEILLEVTNEEISGVAAEVLKSETNKKSKHSVKKSGLQGKICNFQNLGEFFGNSLGTFWGFFGNLWEI